MSLSGRRVTLDPNDKRSRSRQNDPKFGELARLCIDLYSPAMLLDDDVVTDGEAQPSPFTSRLCRKERVEQLVLHFGGYTGAVVPNPDFDAVAEVLGGCSECRLCAWWLHRSR